MIKLNRYLFLIGIIIFLQIFLIGHRMSFNFKNLINFYKKNEGINEFANKDFSLILEIHNALKDKNIYEISFDKELINAPNFYYKAFESIYPIKIKVNSRFFISINKHNYCNLIERYKNFYLYDCQ